MTDEQINQRIAEACPDKFRNENDVWFFQYAKDCWSQCHNNSICTDLNAMHEAQKHIPQNIWNVYINKLARVTGAEESTDRIFLCATARQRAEAFLRTLGKWEEATDKDSLTVQTATAEQSSADQKEVQP